ncbi:hypothetical protein DEO72_LG6g1543 [Vigna unguiculata]|uniref:Uncharacterized protein n=1 Tax=Vigna unguiculata TaxID=3917 RepID=A0A4D6M7L6_VIGUN|nr:hypothetical protein DEO72_LG6g1543 [Vigna unguiculata]
MHSPARASCSVVCVGLGRRRVIRRCQHCSGGDDVQLGLAVVGKRESCNIMGCLQET